MSDDWLSHALAAKGFRGVVLITDSNIGAGLPDGVYPTTFGFPVTVSSRHAARIHEGVPTRFALTFGKSQMPGAAPHWRAGGVMLQHMPRTAMSIAAEAGSGEGGLLSHIDILAGDEGENWTRANALLDTVEEIELIGPTVAPTELLVRLFHEELPRVFDAQPVRFGCSCSVEKVQQTMSIYSSKDISKMTTAEGTVTADCQFCGAHYTFDPKTLGFEAEKATGDAG